MLFLRILLIPFGFLYGLIMELRNRFYDWGIFKSQKFSVPVISVGNLTMGGSGKTPFTIFLAEALKEEYPGIAIVSRGYGRKSKGLQLVSDGRNILLSAEMAGDEPRLIASRLPGVICVVAEKRGEALAFLQEKYNIDLVILDDAFQHRAVRRDVDILLINSKQPLRYNFPFPAGTLREFKHNYKRAHLTVITNSQSEQKLLSEIKIPVFQSYSESAGLRDIMLNSAGRLEELAGSRVIAFAGIAAPQNFKTALQKTGLHVELFKSYADHYSYRKEDLDWLIRQCKQQGCTKILCTEKDLVKIQTLHTGTLLRREIYKKIFAVRLNISMPGQEKFINFLKTILTNQ